MSNLSCIIPMSVKKNHSREIISKILCFCLFAIVFGASLSWTWCSFHPVRLHLVLAKLLLFSLVPEQSAMHVLYDTVVVEVSAGMIYAYLLALVCFFSFRLL